MLKISGAAEYDFYGPRAVREIGGKYVVLDIGATYEYGKRPLKKTPKEALQHFAHMVMMGNHDRRVWVSEHADAQLIRSCFLIPVEDEEA